MPRDQLLARIGLAGIDAKRGQPATGANQLQMHPEAWVAGQVLTCVRVANTRDTLASGNTPGIFPRQTEHGLPVANATSLYFTPKTCFHAVMPATPTTEKGQDTRARILAAAREVFARDGYVEARMVDIAETARLSTGGLYRYFTDKTDVFEALIGDLHEQLYQASGHTEHPFESDPLAALTEANRGYIEHYVENRDVMRAFNEAAGVDERFRSIWWDMRNRHIQRFAKAFETTYGVNRIAGVSVKIATEAMTCLVEQCCFVWFAHEKMNGIDGRKVSVDEATEVVSRAWFNTFFVADD